MKRGVVILSAFVIAFVILIFFISICFADDTNNTKIAVKTSSQSRIMMGAENALLGEGFSNPITCSEEWGGNCSEGPPESFKNTYDSCDTGAGGDESINEVYLNASSVLVGNSITITCAVMIWGIMADPRYGCGYGWQGDGLNIYYRNSPTAQWQRKYQISQVYSCYNYSVSFVPDNVEGVHEARCMIGYRLNPNDECASGSYYDNDDVNFTVYSEFMSITLTSGNPINFGTNAIPGSVDLPAVNNPLIISVDSNVNFDITTKASSDSFTSGSDSFPISNMKWQLTPTSPLFFYSTSEATVYHNQTAGNFNMYHKITIPPGQNQGTYSANIVLTAKKSV